MDYEQLYRLSTPIINTALSLTRETDDIAMPLEDHEEVGRETIALAIPRIAMLRAHLAELEAVLLSIAE